MKNANVVIRKIEEKDMLTVYEQICALEETTFDINLFQSIFIHNINDSNKLYYLAEDEQGLSLGYISCHIQKLLHHCGEVAEIQELFVKSAHRSKGIGALLVNHIESKLKEIGCKYFEVTAQNKRLKTHSFYQNIGFNASHLKFTKTI
jgi:PhnO protein